MAEELKWEELPSNHDLVKGIHDGEYSIEVQHYRAKVPGGWLVKYSKELYRGGVGGMVLVNDPNHEWQIETVEEKKARLLIERERIQKGREYQKWETLVRKGRNKDGKVFKIIMHLENQNTEWKSNGVPENEVIQNCEKHYHQSKDEVIEGLGKIIKADFVSKKQDTDGVKYNSKIELG